MRGFVEYFLNRSIFVNLLSLLLVVVGGYIGFSMNREAFPNIDFDVVSVVTIYPGASPEEVEKLVTNPLEEAIKEVDGLDEFRSTSIENRSVITIKIDPDVSDTDDVINDIRSAVQRAADLPDDAEEPIVTEIGTARSPVIQWSLARVEGTDGRRISYGELREFARQLENEFLRLDGVARVSRDGWRDAEILVDVNPALLQRYRVTTGLITSTLRERNVNFPGGDIETGQREVVVRTAGELEGAQDVAGVPLQSNDIGQSVAIRDVARVYEGFEEPEYLESTMGSEAISLTVVKRESADIITVVNQTKRIVLDFAPSVLELFLPGVDQARADAMAAFLNEQSTIRRTEVIPSAGGFVVSATLNPERIEDEDLDDAQDIFAGFVEEIREAVDEQSDLLPAGTQVEYTYFRAPVGVEIEHVNDVSFFVKRRLGVLRSNGIFGLILVVGTLFVFMGFRTALMVAIGIPVAIGMSFIAMSTLGVTLNLISMFGLILVIGIIVDDAIIVSENFYRYLEEGLDTFEAAVRGTAEVIAPVTATVTTSIAAFAPMMFMSGIFGKFVFTIPLVVILALAASLFESFIILPSHLYDVNKAFPPRSLSTAEGGRWFHILRDTIYEPSLRYVLTHRWRFTGGLVGMLIASIGLFVGLGSFVLFPSAIETLHVKITAQNGLGKAETERYIRAFESVVNTLTDEELKIYVSRVGITQKPGGNDPFTKRGSNYGQVVIYLTSELDRDISTAEIVEKLRRRSLWLLNPATRAVIQERLESAVAELDESEREQVLAEGQFDVPARFENLRGGLVNLEIEMLQGGPPVGKPVAIEITGESFDTLEQIGEDYKAALSEIDGVFDIDDNFLPGKDEIRLVIDEELASQAGISVIQIAQAVNAAFEGTEATSIRRPEEEVQVRVRFADDFRNNLNSLNQIYVLNRQGNFIPVARMARFVNANGITAINHLDGRRLLTVTANIDTEKITSAEAARVLATEHADIPGRYPGYQVYFGGENKDTEESLSSLGRAFAVGIVVIFMILASLFRSLIQPFVVLSAVPFSLIGVLLGFLAHNEPLSFLSLMGVIGLTGVVINDSIVLVDFANRFREEHPEMSNMDVIVKASITRLRAVMLTTLTTVFGLLPTAYGLGGYDPFLVPMALSFAWGLAFSTVLVLGFVPMQTLAVWEFKDRMRVHTGPLFERVLARFRPQ